MHRNQKIAGIVSFALLAAMLQGCSPAEPQPGGGQASPGAGPAAGGQDSAPPPPLKLSFLAQLNGEPPQKDSEAEKHIEKLTGTELEIQWTSDMKAKLPVMIASGDLPKAISFGNSQLRLPYMVSAMRSDVFWELTPYLNDYPNLQAIGDIRYKNTSLDGKIYGLPVVRPLSRHAVTYRKDWLDALGLKEPTTIDELYTVLKAFAHEDPDKNGKNDTYGLMDFKSVGLINNMAPWFGAPNGWAVKDGQFIAAHTTPEYLETLKFIRRLYQEKIINQDFAVMEKAGWNAAFSSGKSGMIFNITNTAFQLEDKVMKTDPKAKLDMFSRLPGAVDKTFAENGTNGIVVIPKSSVPTEAELKRVLAFFDRLADEPMADFFKWGIENKHYKLEGGKAVFSDEAAYKTEVLPYRMLMAASDAAAKPGNEPPHVVKEAKLNADNEQVAVSDPTEPLISATRSEKGGELEKMMLDGVIMFIMGKVDEAGWNGIVEQWRKAGGDKIAEEYAQEYAKSAGK